MTAKDLNKLLNDEISVADFRLSVAADVENYERLMKKNGSTINLNFNENESILLDKSKFNKLLNMVLDNQLSNVHLAYLCDCLTLAEESIVGEIIMEIIFELADPEINGGYRSNKELRNLILRLA